MLSYWEKQSLLHYDCILLGSGIVGLSAAISIKERFPRKRILVLERGLLPAGASTRNAGFACIGSLTEILDDLRHMSQQDVVNLVQMRKKGLQLLRSRIGDDRMQYRENGSYELISEAEISALQQMDAVNALLFDILPGPAFSMADDKIAAFGFSPSRVRHLVKNNFEGELHTGMMMRTLIDLAFERGIEIKTGCEVTSFEEDATQVHVTVNNSLVFSAGQLAICTNAFTTDFLPEIDIAPGRGQVLVTAPIKGLPFKGIFHFDEGYYYFRELNGRVLFGGGRNLDFSGEATTDMSTSTRIQQHLEEKLRTIILPHHPFVIEDRWAGIMAFGHNKQPIVQAYSKRIYLAVRMGGMGIAIGSEAGRLLAALMHE
ncbi:FAD-dependent oxidoreductase [Chitinophaga sp.]|uniref:NAD(P)/FAD-dependent oxidoreductase n=1 Tax=Chitinophaga sp. TaxID=1869181 RepID=UPI0031D38FE4